MTIENVNVPTLKEIMFNLDDQKRKFERNIRNKKMEILDIEMEITNLEYQKESVQETIDFYNKVKSLSQKDVSELANKISKLNSNSGYSF